MSQRANPVMIGLFVVGAIALVLVGVAVFGSGLFFQNRITYSVFFDGSLNGLSLGAPVSFRGVKLGSVTGMHTLLDSETGDIQIEVVIQLNEGVVQTVGPPTELSRMSGAQAVDYMIEKRGLRAKLAQQSFVTGLLYVDLDLYPDTPIERSPLPTRYVEMPTVPSVLQEIENRARETFELLSELPLKELFDNFRSAIAGIDRLANSEELTSAIAELDGTLRDVRATLRSRDGNVVRLAASLEKASNQASETLAQAEESMGALSEDSPVRYELSSALVELAAAARSIRILTDYLQQHPEALLAGKRGQ